MRNKHKSPLISVFFIFSVFLFLILFSVALIRFFGKSIWDGKRRITLVMQNLPQQDNELSDYLGIFTIEPEKKNAFFLLIPGNTLLDVPYGYKKFPAASVYRLGELDRQRGGGKLLAKSMEISFGYSIEGFMVEYKKNPSLIPQKREDLAELKKKYFSLFGFLSSFSDLLTWRGNTVTNFSFLDRFRLWRGVSWLRLDQISFFDLTDSGVLKMEKQVDGSEVFELDKDNLDLTVSANFQDSSVRQEKITVEIANATGLEKIAAAYGRILENMGIHVIVKSTAAYGQKEECLLYLSDDSLKNNIIVKRLKEIYRCQMGFDKRDKADRSDIKAIVGEDFIK